ncbi:peptidylprolyl isomerase [Sunxiuqinia elliptica]|uniref:Periplasmic chaperone for outer membrane proteins SurA n=1 Tax=Sunxiuqinia elliptica TaxID=655355 RepID=A0A4R6GXZ9_9BACT|nr:peptidylprolyl isomerase [Sunxiuqinia elliptica]TDN99870.1 periplasmic chaperone for outer membrane proteins SurA [Sunxiuqinia elliptica]TDO57062.1 periplasmic chaperone for outer membrane proteins SurA [Sunxiuqinia elliptica]
MFRKVFIGILFLSCFSTATMAQDKIIDQIVAVVGSNIILKSDIESMYIQQQAQGIVSDGDMKCEILEDFLVEKLLLAEAELDTNIIVSDSQINQNLDQRMQYFVQHLGSEKAVENYFKKPITQIKADLEEVIRNQSLTGQMQGKIVDKVQVTPAEVRYHYRNLKKEEIPVIEPQVEYAQITLFPPIALEEENRIKARLREFKKRVEDGENFATLAVLYSEGPSAVNGGELGYMGRAQLDPNYAASAFNLKGDRISNVVKSEFGYHIIQLVDRKGEQVNSRHIILKPKATPEAMEEAYNRLDSLANFVRKEDLSFSDAALRYSFDKNSRNSGGVVINPNTMSTKWRKEELDPDVSKVLDKLKINEISEPFKTIDDKQRTVYKIVKLINRTEKHRANMQEDYQMLNDIYLQKKQEEALDEWISEQQAKTYISIDDSYINCNFKFKGWIK